MHIVPKVMLKPPPTLLLNKLNLFIMLNISNCIKLMSLQSLTKLISTLPKLQSMINTKPVKQRLLTTKLPKFIEINHNVKFLAQFQRIKKIFQFANQLNQQSMMMTKILIIKIRSTLHTVRASLNQRMTIEEETVSENIEEETVQVRRTIEEEMVLPLLTEGSEVSKSSYYTTVK